MHVADNKPNLVLDKSCGGLYNSIIEPLPAAGEMMMMKLVANAYYEDVNNHETFETYEAALKANQEAAEACGCPECGSSDVTVREVGEVPLMQLNTICNDCKFEFQVAPFELKFTGGRRR